MEEASKTRLYSTTFNLNDNSLLLVTTTLRFPLWTRKEYWVATAKYSLGGQKVESAWGSSTWWLSHITVTKESKTQIILTQHYFFFYPFKTEEKQHPRRKSNKIWQMTSLLMKLRFFWLHNTWALKQKKMKPYASGTQTSQNIRITQALQGDIIRHLHLLCILKDYLLQIATQKIWQRCNQLLLKTGEKLLFLHHSLPKPE